MRPIQVHTRLIHTHNSVGGVLYKATGCEDPGIQGLGGWGAGGSSWAEQGLPTAGTHQDDHKGYKVYCLWSSLFCISHLTCCSLFDAQKRLILQLEELKQQWEIKLSSGNIFSSLLNNVELINWVELVNVTRVNVKYLFSMWHWTMSCDKFPVVSVKVTSATLVQGSSRRSSAQAGSNYCQTFNTHKFKVWLCTILDSSFVFSSLDFRFSF